MKTILYSILLLVNILIIQSCKSENQAQIENCYHTFNQCWANNDYDGMYQLVDFNTKEYFSKLKSHCNYKYIHSTQFDRMSIGERSIIRGTYAMFDSISILQSNEFAFFKLVLSSLKLSKAEIDRFSTMKLYDFEIFPKYANCKSISSEYRFGRDVENFLKEDNSWKYNFFNEFKLVENETTERQKKTIEALYNNR